MKRNLCFFSLTLLSLVLLCSFRSKAQSESERPNVLFIMVDDLKPAVGAYGDKVAITPNMDALIARGVRFDRAYSIQAVCVASRDSMLLGSGSTSTGLYDFGSGCRQVCADAVSLPESFNNQGDYAQALGMVFVIGHITYNDEQS